MKQLYLYDTVAFKNRFTSISFTHAIYSISTENIQLFRAVPDSHPWRWDNNSAFVCELNLPSRNILHNLNVDWYATRWLCVYATICIINTFTYGSQRVCVSHWICIVYFVSLVRFAPSSSILPLRCFICRVWFWYNVDRSAVVCSTV